MRRHLVVSALLVGPLIGLAAGCSGSSGSSAPTSSTVPAPTTTAAPTTTQPKKATQGVATSDDAANALVAAFKANDLAAAARIADPEAVLGIWATPVKTIWMRGCTTDPSLPEGGCIYKTGQGLVQVNTEHRNIGWVVTSAVFDPLRNGSGTEGDSPSPPPTSG